jgi:hypothetical protein
MKQLIYTGVGSRETPKEILTAMYNLGLNLAEQNWLLRSGHAPGADQAFEAGCVHQGGKKQIFLPWDGFENASQTNPDYITPAFSDHVMELAAEIHPAWDKCKRWVRRMHARNINQVIGPDDFNPVLSDLLICWTKGASGAGGTGQAIRLAHRLGVPVFDLADSRQWDQLEAMVIELQAKNSA